MFSFRKVGSATLLLSMLANVAAAQSSNAPAPPRDSLWNGTLIGLGAGIGATGALDAVFCENGFGGCDTPWAAYFTLGGLGAATGAGIDFLIGRRSNGRTTSIRISPMIGRTRKGVFVSLKLPQRPSAR